MTPTQLKALKPGDLVRHKSSSSAYIVTGNYGDRVTAVRTVDLTNSAEWDVVHPDGSVIKREEYICGSCGAKTGEVHRSRCILGGRMMD